MTKRALNAKKRAIGRRGSVPMFVCALVPAIVFMGVVTVRAANSWVVQARLQSALDAGALAAARDINRLQNGTAAEKQAALDRIKALVAGIYNDSAGNSTPLSASNVAVTLDGDKVNLSGSVSATDPTTGGPKTITRTSGATRSNSGLELALVFDITLSMTATDAGNGMSRIEAAKQAGTSLLEVLYDDLPRNKDGTPNTNNKKWLEHLYISVVPFATAVNFGSKNTHFLAPTGSAQTDRDSWTGARTTWGGCTEMRALSLGDQTPGGSSGLPRYFAPSKYDPAKKHIPNSSASACRADAAYQDTFYLANTATRTPASWHNVCMTHNDWTAPTAVYNSRQNWMLKTMETWSSHVAAGIDPWSVAHGPNMMCPSDAFQVLPLTRDRATVQASINAMYVRNLPFSAGTNIAPGLMAGWFTLSPNWRKVDGVFDGWSRTSKEPQTTADVRPPLPALPLDYHLANRQKVLILLTDGDNNWFSARDFQTDNKSTSYNEGLRLVLPESVSGQEEGFYGSYGYIRDHLGKTTLVAAESAINDEAVKWCEKIRTRKPKDKPSDPEGPEQITVYTISFGPAVSGDAKTVLQKCASTKNGQLLHYHAPDATKLKEIFSAIGAELAKLRLSH